MEYENELVISAEKRLKISKEDKIMTSFPSMDTLETSLEKAKKKNKGKLVVKHSTTTPLFKVIGKSRRLWSQHNDDFLLIYVDDSIIYLAPRYSAVYAKHEKFCYLDGIPCVRYWLKEYLDLSIIHQEVFEFLKVAVARAYRDVEDLLPPSDMVDENMAKVFYDIKVQRPIDENYIIAKLASQMIDLVSTEEKNGLSPVFVDHKPVDFGSVIHLLNSTLQVLRKMDVEEDLIEYKMVLFPEEGLRFGSIIMLITAFIYYQRMAIKYSIASSKVPLLFATTVVMSIKYYSDNTYLMKDIAGLLIGDTSTNTVQWLKSAEQELFKGLDFNAGVKEQEVITLMGY